ncbi:serine/threonine-protein kinase PknB [Abditibacteriota bacterium]|nr:serine/threonine-protein kinase PknB [Abditibacteriota bacterium]
MRDYPVVKELHVEARTWVYRSIRDSDQRFVIVKMLRGEVPSPHDILRLQHEYEITRTLPPICAVQACNFEVHRYGVALILEDFGGISLQGQIPRQGFDLPTFFAIAIPLAQSLSQVHESKIIHKDIKPRNVIVNSATGEVRLTGFAISSRLSVENVAIGQPESLQGTLAYMSPEQTGRINQSVDYHTDLYSLGITLYEMLAGHPPFESADPLELVHCHIARTPPPLQVARPELPGALSDIVMKLLAKSPLERYQSARGLKEDLEECERQWQTTGAIHPFPLGRTDFSGHFQIPPKLYGREADIAVLMESFERVGAGAMEMVLLSGYSGIGKTTLVQEIHKPIVQRRGYFVSGKFDQFRRNIPYASLVQAFQELMRQLLGESEESLARWNKQLLNAMGANGQIIIDVIPELELIIGPQPPTIDLGPQESQNRFNLLFQSFIGVFTKEEHPLVLFLDDLQWADTASLNIIRALSLDANRRHLLLIGTFRNNEVNASHPLVLLTDEIRKIGCPIHDIVVRPLVLSEVKQLLSETLDSPDADEDTGLLAELALSKSGGNPFFLNQLLKSLYQENLLRFNQKTQKWQWDVEEIRRTSIPDNVVEFMGSKIQKLPEATQRVLKLAACLGNVFDSKTLSLANSKSQSQTADELWASLQEGLVLPLDNSYKYLHSLRPEEQGGMEPGSKATGTRQISMSVEASDTVPYKFAHDRIRQATYSLIPDAERKAIHLAMGRLLLEQASPDERNDRVFEIAEHFNSASELVTDRDEVLQLARLNYDAGLRAKSSTAFEAAGRYFQMGATLLPEIIWQDDYRFAFDLHKEWSQSAYLTGDHDVADKLFDFLMEKANTDLDRVDVYLIRVQLYTTTNEYIRAVEVGLEGLRLLNMPLPMRPGQFNVLREIIKVKRKQGKRKAAALIHLPLLTDSQTKAQLSLLSILTPAAILSPNPQLFSLIILKMVGLSLRYGNSALSCQAYTLYGFILGTGMGDFKRGQEFADMALQLVEQFSDNDAACKTKYAYGAFVGHWRRPMREIWPLLQQTYQLALEVGNTVYAGYAIFIMTSHAAISGVALSEVEAEVEKYLPFLHWTKDPNQLGMTLLTRQMCRNLQGRTRDHATLDSEGFDEAIHVQQLQDKKNEAGVLWYYILKLRLAYIYGDYHLALKMARIAESNLVPLVGMGYLPDENYFSSLTLAALYPTASDEEKRQTRKKLRTQQKALKKWANNAPGNYLHKYLLVAAEVARIFGRKQEALDLYDRAIAAAHENGDPQNVAISNELAALFCQNTGRPRLAQTYLTDAHLHYQAWGALAKVRQLERLYPDLVAPSPAVPQELPPLVVASTPDTQADTDALGTTDSVGLDLATVIKVSQVLSGEIDLERLLSRLMSYTLENAGASRGALILEKEGHLYIEAESATQEGEIRVMQSIPVENSQELPVSIIQYVARTRESVLLHDASEPSLFSSDPYIVSRKPHSLLCAPIIHQVKLVAILFLENNLASGAFARERLEVLRVISSQAAISLENALLYRQLEEYSRTLENKVEERTEQLQEKNLELSSTLAQLHQMQAQLVFQEKMASLGVLTAGVAHEIRNPLNFINNFAKLSVGFAEELEEEIRRHESKLDADTVSYVVELATDLKENSEKINQHGKRAESIIHSMLLHSRGAVGQPEPAALNQIVKESVDLAYHGIRATYPSFLVSLEECYDDSVGTMQIVPQEISRVFLNIASNAFDALREHQKTAAPEFSPKLSVSTLNLGDHVEICIRDNGTGMPQSIKEKIFDPFFTTKPTGQGTGLGLSMSYDIVVQQHRGEIRVESQEGQFTEFVVSLPC